MKSRFATSLLMAIMALGLHWVGTSRPDAPLDVAFGEATQCELATRTRGVSLESAKLAAETTAGRTCEQFANVADTESVTAVSAKVDSAGKRITVSSLVGQALTDQLRLLLARKNDLERWSRADQAHFAKWFGTTSPTARQTIYKRIRVLMLLNQEYSVGNFRRVEPSRPGLFAFVHATDPSKIFVDQAFVMGPRLGENSRPGTICHEMSHFVLAGGTKDFCYGVGECKLLARKNPAQALANADSFEFYVEHAR
jgi:peptidyl-Lys metalloendopeptidase